MGNWQYSRWRPPNLYAEKDMLPGLGLRPDYLQQNVGGRCKLRNAIILPPGYRHRQRRSKRGQCMAWFAGHGCQFGSAGLAEYEPEVHDSACRNENYQERGYYVRSPGRA